MNFGIVDDDVFCVMAPPEDLIAFAPNFMQVVYDQYERIGPQLHLKPSNTASVVILQGEGTSMHRERFQQEPCTRGGVLFFADGKELFFPVADTYFHVGCIIHADDMVSQDVVSKMCRIREATKP